MWALFAHTYVGVAYKKIIQSFDWWYVKPFYVSEINILRKIALCLWIYLHEKEYIAFVISNYFIILILIYKALKICKFFYFSLSEKVCLKFKTFPFKHIIIWSFKLDRRVAYKVCAVIFFKVNLLR